MDEKLNAVTKIIRLAGFTRKKKLANLKAAEKETAALNDYLGVGPVAAILFTAIFERACNKDNTTISVMAEYYDCSTIDILAHKSELDELVASRLVFPGEYNLVNSTTAHYTVNPIVFECIIDNSPISLHEDKAKVYDKIDFIQETRRMTVARRSKWISTQKLFTIVSKLEHTLRYSGCGVYEIKRFPDRRPHSFL